MKPGRPDLSSNSWRLQSGLYEPLSDMLPVLEAHSVQLGPGTFRVDATIAHVRDVWLTRIRVSPKSLAHVVVDPRVLSFIIPMSWDGEDRVNGQFATPSTMFLNSGPDGYSGLGAKRDFFNIGLMRDRFEASLAALLGLTVDEISLHDGAMTLPLDTLGRMRRKLDACLTRLARSRRTSLAASENTAEAIYDMMLDSYLAAVPRPKQRLSFGPSREKIVRAVEEHFAEFYEARISLADLCAAAGVSQTVLYQAFHEIHGIPPLTYLKNRRLMKARTKLIRHDADKMLVKEAAFSQGLTHLGRFSRDYQSLFGESPSVTLSSSNK